MGQAAKTKKVFDNRYEILEIVGRGERSVVYHARHLANPAIEVALKVLADRDGQPSYAEKLKKEALAMVSCRHRYVLRLDDFHSVGKLSYLCTEYAPLGSLAAYLTARGGTLPAEQARVFLTQAAEALANVHRAGIVHRDLKLENILVMNDEEIRLGDFGLAVLPGEEANMEELETGVGTMNYMAPEVLEGKSYSASSDLYALGVTFYEAISGANPFSEAPLASQLDVRTDRNVQHLRALAPQCPRELADVVMKLMSYEPYRRFANADDLAIHLKTLNSTGSSGSPRGTRNWLPFRKKIPEGAKRFKLREKERAPALVERSAATEQIEKVIDSAPNIRPADDTHLFTEAARSPAVSASGNAAVSATTTAEIAQSASAKAADDLFADFDPNDPTHIDAAIDALFAEDPDDKFSARLNDALRSSSPAEKPSTEVTSQSLDRELSALLSQEPAETARSPSPTPETTPPEPEPIKETEALVAVTNEIAPTTDSSSSSVETSLESERHTGRFERRVTGPLDPESLTEREAATSQLEAPRSRVSVVSIFALVVLAMVVFSYRHDLSRALKLSSLFGSASSGEGDTGLVEFPLVPRKPFEFPFLPQGLYTGEISGVLPGVTTSLSIVSLPESRSMVFIVGVPGWTPHTVDISAAYAAIERGAPVRPIYVASNGIALAITGRSVEGELIGYVKNLVSGIKGEWRAAPHYDRE